MGRSITTIEELQKIANDLNIKFTNNKELIDKLIQKNPEVVYYIDWNKVEQSAPELKTSSAHAEYMQEKTLSDGKFGDKQADKIAQKAENSPITYDYSGTNIKGEKVDNKFIAQHQDLQTILQAESENNVLPINPTQWMDFVTQQQKKEWEREDTIRKETQAREDNAYQRAVADMKAAGINVGALTNISPAQSGGGITQATQMNTSMLSQSIDQEFEEKMKEIQNSFQGSQQEKDRILKALSLIVELL